MVLHRRIDFALLQCPDKNWMEPETSACLTRILQDPLTSVCLAHLSQSFLHSRAKLWSGGGGTGFLQTWPDTDKRKIFLTRGVSCSHGLLTFRVDGLGVVRVYILCACPYDMC